MKKLEAVPEYGAEIFYCLNEEIRPFWTFCLKWIFARKDSF